MTQTYADAFTKVYLEGKKRTDRTGTGTIGTFGETIRYDLSKGFPLITEKRTWWKGVVTELQWILKGERTGQTDFMLNRGVHIWDEWADENNHLGPVYGAQARRWQGPFDQQIDQLQRAITAIQMTPDSRRILVSMWNPGELDQQALPPCHLLYQFYVQDGKLSIQVYQRSADMFLGVPFDLASYALLTHMVAGVTRLEVGEMIYQLGDSHIYLNHMEEAKLLMTRIGQTRRPLPILDLPAKDNIDDYIHEPFSFFEDALTGYNPYPTISAEVAV